MLHRTLTCVSKYILMLLKIKILGLFILFFSFTQAQNIAIGQWRVHLPYNSIVSLTESGTKIYCASRNGGLFYYDKSDNNLTTMTKISGLSDNKISTIKSTKNNVVVIAYDNANIDILKGNKIYNISDIKRKNILGKKEIHAIHFLGDYCYLSCGFGIVVIDLNKIEVHDTYIIGPNGVHSEVFDFCDDSTYFYAATDTGVFKARIDNPNLANFSEWTIESGIPAFKYNAVKAFSKKIYANKTGGGSEVLYFKNADTWSVFDSTFSGNVQTIGVFYNKLIITKTKEAAVYGGLGNPSDLQSKRGTATNSINTAIIDVDGTIWLADQNSGLIKSKDVTSFEVFFPNGPRTTSVRSMVSTANDLWVATGGTTNASNNLYNNDGVFHFDNRYWSALNRDNTPAFANAYDFMSITLDPKDENHLLISTFFTPGLIDYTVGGPFIQYTCKNSSLQPENGDSAYTRITGSAFDSQNNLWVLQHDVNMPLHVRLKKDNKWNAFFVDQSSKGARAGNILIDKNDYKWVNFLHQGIFVYNDNKTITDISDDKIVHLTDLPAKGNLQSLDVNCFEKDQDGAIWIGTEKGISVVYNSNALFNGNPNAQPVYIQQDGHTQLLLAYDAVTAIAIDGGNRKWFGTRNSGVFLMSAEGTKEILHFDISNSPLLSNSITSIAINPKTGEVFFGTVAGIISYRSTSTKGDETFKDEVYAFPNPVRPEYTGLIAVKGLAKNVNVKITDAGGNLVYETKAIGGQAIWDGKNFQGIRAQSGVYLVMCTNDDGSQTYVTKILFVN
jgi:hypothetical protein